jgi:hypothetical protein
MQWHEYENTRWGYFKFRVRRFVREAPWIQVLIFLGLLFFAPGLLEWITKIR